MRNEKTVVHDRVSVIGAGPSLLVQHDFAPIHGGIRGSVGIRMRAGVGADVIHHENVTGTDLEDLYSSIIHGYSEDLVD